MATAKSQKLASAQATTLYLINKTTTTISLNDGKLTVPVNGWVPITAKDSTGDHIAESVRRGWLQLQETSPETISNPGKTPISGTTPINSGVLEFPRHLVKPIVSATTEGTIPSVAPTQASASVAA